MRRESRKLESSEKNKNVLYIGASILGIGIIAFVLTFVLYGNKVDQQQSKINTEKLAGLVQNTTNNTNTQSASTQIGKTVEESKNEIQNVTKSETKDETIVNQNNKTENKTAKTEDNTKKEKIKEELVKKEETKDPTFKNPVEGEILKGYAKDNLVYSETLKEWTTHLGIDIKAEKTSIVKAASDGKIKSIKTDPRYGLSIIIEHQNGFETLYSNLLTTEFVNVKEEVKQGQTIATVGNTATFEIADETHLHFEISRNGEKLDPTQYIK